MDATQIEVTKIIMQTLSSGRGRADVESALSEKGYDLTAFAHHIESCLKQHAARKRTTGHLLIAVGILICFASCVITLVSGSIGSSSLTLIGLTSIGIIILFCGLVMIF